MTSPLANLKIVEFAGLGPVPLAGQLLADLGADADCGRSHYNDLG